jgi:hypothetical protein
MGLFSSWKRKPVEQGVSHCRYFVCPKCNGIYDKDAVLSSWRAMFFFTGSSQAVVTGTRTCKCGTVMQVPDIYKGIHDLPRRLWDKVAGPVEVE